MQQETVTLIVAGLGIGGTLGGIVIGHFLSRSWQRKQWLLDRRHEEFRELMSAIAIAFAKCGDPRYHLMNPTVEKAMELNEASANCLLTIQNRIYIAKYIKPLRLDEKWMDAFDEIMKSKNPDKYGAAVREMMNSLVEVATDHY